MRAVQHVRRPRQVRPGVRQAVSHERGAGRARCGVHVRRDRSVAARQAVGRVQRRVRQQQRGRLSARVDQARKAHLRSRVNYVRMNSGPHLPHLRLGVEICVPGNPI